MKAVFLDDGFLTHDIVFAQENESILELFSGIDSRFVKDTNPQRWDNLAAYIRKIEEYGPEGWIVPDKEVMQELEDADVLFVNISAVTDAMLRKANRLRAIFLLRSGFEGINIKSASELGISVSNCPSRLAEPVADMTIALMLSECRGIVRGNLRSTNGIWKQLDDYDDRSNATLGSLTIGLVGYGGIARAVARRLINGFGAQVIAFDPYVSLEQMQIDGVARVETLDELLKKSDIVSVHMRVSEETKGMFGEREFSLMKPTAIFINTARGSLVDESALIKALQNKVIRGAGLDVYTVEPLPADSPLIKMPNVTLMPHRAGAISNITVHSLTLLLREFRRFLNDEPLQFMVNQPTII